MNPATEKQMSCRRVRLKATFVFTLLKSFGTDTKGISFPPYQLLALGRTILFLRHGCSRIFQRRKFLYLLLSCFLSFFL